MDELFYSVWTQSTNDWIGEDQKKTMTLGVFENPNLSLVVEASKLPSSLLPTTNYIASA